jgi:hypothetical protein
MISLISTPWADKKAPRDKVAKVAIEKDVVNFMGWFLQANNRASKIKAGPSITCGPAFCERQYLAKAYL